MDVGRFLRLQGAIKSLLDSIPVTSASVAGDSMVNGYMRFRAEVRDSIPEENRDEFDRLFPDSLERPTASYSRHEFQSTKFHRARGLLGSLAGWLDGYVQEARMTMEAEAYAQARVKEERGVGFTGGGTS